MGVEICNGSRKPGYYGSIARLWIQNTLLIWGLALYWVSKTYLLWGLALYWIQNTWLLWCLALYLSRKPGYHGAKLCIGSRIPRYYKNMAIMGLSSVLDLKFLDPISIALYFLFVCLFCCFTPKVNSYGHDGTVSSPNHTFLSS